MNAEDALEPGLNPDLEDKNPQPRKSSGSN
jgi:hypothetical protein